MGFLVGGFVFVWFGFEGFLGVGGEGYGGHLFILSKNPENIFL